MRKSIELMINNLQQHIEECLKQRSKYKSGSVEYLTYEIRIAESNYNIQDLKMILQGRYQFIKGNSLKPYNKTLSN